MVEPKDVDPTTLDIIKHTAKRVQQVMRDSVELFDDGDDAMRLLFYVLDDLAITSMVAVIPKLLPENQKHEYALRLVLATINHTASSDKAKKFFADSVAQWHTQKLLRKIVDAQPPSK